MMFGIDTATIGKAYILAGLMSCDPQPAAGVNIIFDNIEPVVTHSLNHEDLGRFQTSTKVSHGSNEIMITGGITESRIDTAFQAGFKMLKNPVSGNVCLFLDRVDVNVKYEPIVHIASNYPEGSCRFQTTWLHELQHVNIDLLTIKEYLPYLEKAAADAAAAIPVIGPIDNSAVDSTQKAIADRISAALTGISGHMDDIRGKRQQLIDTRQEYQRLSRACPNER